MKSKKIITCVILAGSFFVGNRFARAGALHEKSVSKAHAAILVQEKLGNMLADSIDLSKPSFSEKELAAFPVFNPPTDIAPLNKPLIRDFDRLFFPTQEGMIPVEGKVYKAFVTSVTGKEWSLPVCSQTNLDNSLESIFRFIKLLIFGLDTEFSAVSGSEF